MNTALTAPDVLTYLLIAAVVMLIVVLYQVIFIVVDLRKVMHRIQEITKEVEGMIMKPIHVADKVLEGIVAFLEEQQKPKKKKSSKKSK